MTSSRLSRLAQQYRNAIGPYRVKILDLLYADGRNNSIEALELCLGLSVGIIQSWYKRYRITRRRYRRWGLPVPARLMRPPPGVRPQEAAEAAKAAAGGRGEIRFARRDTFSAHGDSEIEERVARRLKLYDPAVPRGR